MTLFILLLHFRSAYIEVRDEMDEMRKQWIQLLSHFRENWFRDCHDFQPNTEEVHSYQLAFDFHVLAIWEGVFSVSCIEHYDPFIKEEHIKSRLQLLKQILQSKSSMQASKTRQVHPTTIK